MRLYARGASASFRYFSHSHSRIAFEYDWNDWSWRRVSSCGLVHPGNNAKILASERVSESTRQPTSEQARPGREAIRWELRTRKPTTPLNTHTQLIKSIFGASEHAADDDDQDEAPSSFAFITTQQSSDDGPLRHSIGSPHRARQPPFVCVARARTVRAREASPASAELPNDSNNNNQSDQGWAFGSVRRRDSEAALDCRPSLSA